MENIQSLIENIKKCNLSQADKELLLEKLEQQSPDIEGFLERFIKVFRISKELLEHFDIDIGSFF